MENVIEFETEEQAKSFMSKCMEYNNQGVKRVLYNWASSEGDEADTVNAVSFECPNDCEYAEGRTLTALLREYAEELAQA